MSLTTTYRKLLADLKRELIEIDRDLAHERERQTELSARRAEVVAGINGITAELERSGFSDGDYY